MEMKAFTRAVRVARLAKLNQPPTTGDILFELTKACDLLSISDGSEGHRYAVAYAKRDADIYDYVEGDDLHALLVEVLRRVV